jgi:hypothetical protein
MHSSPLSVTGTMTLKGNLRLKGSPLLDERDGLGKARRSFESADRQGDLHRPHEMPLGHVAAMPWPSGHRFAAHIDNGTGVTSACCSRCTTASLP